MNYNVILASSSPRRKELLSLVVPNFKILIPDVDESILEGELPLDLVVRLATLKSKAIELVDDLSLVVAADTIVVYQGAILGKPANPLEARDMLSALSGNQHQVFTAIAVRTRSDFWVECSETLVTFRKLKPLEIENYILLGEPFDKAGGYGAQSGGARFISKIEGSFTNVVGLDLAVLIKLLDSAGFKT